MILPIAHLPAQILRREVQNIAFPIHKNVKRLMQNMLETVKHAQGVGLAAPQVSQNLNIALIYLVHLDLPPFFIINPRIIETGRQSESSEEGCLSMPGVYGNVSRPKNITVEYQNLKGEKVSITDDTFLARVLQHEIDHLNQTLIIDKLEKISHGQELIERYAS